jgi:hypothetical protein
MKGRESKNNSRFLKSQLILLEQLNLLKKIICEQLFNTGRPRLPGVDQFLNSNSFVLDQLKEITFTMNQKIF